MIIKVTGEREHKGKCASCLVAYSTLCSSSNYRRYRLSMGAFSATSE